MMDLTPAQRSRLDAFFRREVAPLEGALAWQCVDGGQSNPIDVVQAGTARYVLRRKPAAPLPTAGIPTDAGHVATYGRARGLPVGPSPHWPCYHAFNVFRLAAIQQGVARRALEDTAASERAQAVGRRVQATAEAGWRAAPEACA
jgi:aminoglycoside phosphotransferase (APT) family kinase protein